MEKPTIEFVLPDCGAKVVMYAFVSGGDYREMQKFLLNSIQVDVNAATGSRDMKDIRVDKLSGTITMEQEEMALKYLLKEIFTTEGNKVDDMLKFIYDCSIEDSDFVFAKANEVTLKSRLSSETKKKLQETQ